MTATSKEKVWCVGMWRGPGVDRKSGGRSWKVCPLTGAGSFGEEDEGCYLVQDLPLALRVVLRGTARFQ